MKDSLQLMSNRRLVGDLGFRGEQTMTSSMVREQAGLLLGLMGLEAAP